MATQQTGGEAGKKRSKTFLIVLILLLIVGGWFGISKYLYSKHHETTDDAQVEANINPMNLYVPRVNFTFYELPF